ncbi:JAB domain-containing protein [Fulvivirgaceae bacterium BMA12]|uniref:JAB domain-containing protein n=1 Tax=Agaribacillus aureus TaxID=3051825 RepID=A0ABT8LES6_9BACT|nr:JAB domain-containing protein [Fulvivirgaceae bacterium BMA12]
MKPLTSEFEEVRLVYRNRVKAADRPNVNDADKAYKILRESWDMGQIALIEECKALLLDRQMRLMSIAHIAKGGMSGTYVDPKVVFSIALKRRAHRIILAHNHPSGTLEPSAADIQLTKELMLSGKALQLPLEDHLIITQDDYCSMLTGGYMDHRPA